jgi:predicted  nucleic acid-binding Zn-ribbon protein
MADIGEMTPKRLEMKAKRDRVELAQLQIKLDKLEIRKMELEEAMDDVDSGLKAVAKEISDKKQELK